MSTGSSLTFFPTIYREATDGKERVVLSSVSTEDPSLAFLPSAGTLEDNHRGLYIANYCFHWSITMGA